MKIVLDTDVLVAAIRSAAGASAELLRRARQRRLTLIVTVPLMLEYEAVTTRPAQLTASALDADQVGRLLDVIAAIAIKMPVDYGYRPITLDPDDDMVLEAAINGTADAIVTFNRRDFGDGPSRFGIACLLPREALERMR